MKSHQGIAAPAAARTSASRLPADPAVIKTLGAAAFALLAVALCARDLLGEERSLTVVQMVTSPDAGSTASLMARHVAHLLAAGGIGLGALWVVLSRRRWRWGALETGALVLAGAALVSVPVASDKRVAINIAIDMVLPLIAAATLYQLLLHRPAWRRALLATVVAVAAANCCKATAQVGWEYKRSWDSYQRGKAEFWSQQGIALDDPAVAAFEASIRTPRPMGFIRGPNVLSSFLLLGMAGTGAAAAACGWRRGRGAAVTAALVGIVAWQLVMLLTILTAGAIVGLLAAMAALGAGLWMWNRSGWLAIALAGGLVLLQTALVVLAISSPGVHRAFLDYQGAGGKVRTFGARLCYWQGALQLFAAHPFTGVGPSQFGNRYLPVRPAYLDETPLHSHNWLINMAAEWGVLGVLGVLIAVAGSGWFILLALARPPDEAMGFVKEALLLAVLVVLGCWLVVVFDMPSSQWAGVLPLPVAVSLVAAGLVSFGRLGSRAGHVILLAGLVGFFVHCTVEVTSSVPGVMWPFWALVALAMAWNAPVPSKELTAAPRRMMQLGPILAGAAMLAVVALTVRPLYAVIRMQQAQRMAVNHRSEQAVVLLREAATADPLDPLPLKTAAFLQYRLAQSDPARAVEHFRDYVALSLAAAQLNPLDHGFWRSLALANMFLATATGDFARVDEAIRSMQRSLELNPQWPAGWLELARMAAIEGDHPDRPALLKTALEATDKALALEDGRPENVPAALTAREGAELLALRKQLLRRLQASAAQRSATQPSP